MSLKRVVGSVGCLRWGESQEPHGSWEPGPVWALQRGASASAGLSSQLLAGMQGPWAERHSGSRVQPPHGGGGGSQLQRLTWSSFF